MKRKIINWPEYNKSLVNRGSITFWFSEDVIKGWTHSSKPNKQGRPETYTNVAITYILMSKSLYNLSYRGVTGFVQSLTEMLKLDIPVPSYTQICRRAAKVKIPKFSRSNISDVVIDSSGLKIYGAGEWRQQHGKSERREWRKLHLAIDPNTNQIVASELSDGNCSDCTKLPELIKEIRKPKKVYGDGAYDTKKCHKAIIDIGAEPIIPPRSNAKPNKLPWALHRDDAISKIGEMDNNNEGRSHWKNLKSYHKRSLVETAFSRYKGMLGGTMYSRKMQSQIKESQIKCLILNKMANLGMPTYKKP